MAASDLSLFSPIRKKIVLPISEAFARILFEGREHTVNAPGAGDGTRRLLFKENQTFQDAAAPLVGLGLNPTMDARYPILEIFRKSRNEINREKWRGGPDDTSMMRIDDDDRSILRIDSWHSGSKTHDPVYEFYGEWDDSGPRLVFKRLVGRGIFTPTLKTMNRFIERLKNIDEWVAGQPDITVRMAQAVPEIEERNTIFDPSRPVGTNVPAPGLSVHPNLRNAGEGRPALPEEVIRGPLLSMLYNQNTASRNLAAPLSRLVKKGGRRGLSAKRETRKTKSRGRAHSRKKIHVVIR